MAECPLPRRADGVALRPQVWRRRRLYAARDPEGQRYFHLGEREGWILEHLDGGIDREALGVRFREAFGEALDPAWLERVLDAFARQGLLAGQAAESPPREERRSILMLRLWGFRAEPFLDRLLPFVRGAFTAPAVACGAAVAAAGFAAAATRQDALRSDWARILEPRRLILFYISLSIVVTLHELAHGLACRRFGARVRTMGIYLLYFQPCLYTDVTDSWLLERRSRRLWIILGPSFLQLVIAGAALAAWALLPDGSARLAVLSLAAVSGFGIIWNVNPLLPLDGYHALVEILQIPNLRRKSFSLLGRWFGRGDGGTETVRSRGEAAVLAAFAVGAGAYSLGLIALMLWLALQWAYTHLMSA
ncbi:MAG: M50 family metallopeptidase [Planctomycetes bacterium]|nr:M50 family metallopeptidase [Planctomycetota bacterium]